MRVKFCSSTREQTHGCFHSHKLLLECRLELLHDHRVKASQLRNLILIAHGRVYLDDYSGNAGKVRRY